MRVHLRFLAVIGVLLATLTACSTDDGAGVRTLDGGGSGSASASGSGSSSGVSPDESSEPLGGYAPVSDVAGLAAVSRDVCDVQAAAGEGDFAAAEAAYAKGGNSLRDNGTARTLKGFATTVLDEPSWQASSEYFGSDTWLDDYVTAALQGTGKFADLDDAARKQAVNKGVQNGVLIAWVEHELDGAKALLAANDVDTKGAAHHVDEAWALYHGDEPECAPFLTAEKRGADFGRGSAVNNALLAAFEQARDAAVEGDAEAFAAADDTIRHHLLVTYLQAVIKYTSQAASGNDDAKEKQMEGQAFFRVIAAQVAAEAPDAAAALQSALEGPELPTQQQVDKALELLRAAYGDLGVTATEIGTLT